MVRKGWSAIATPSGHRTVATTLVHELSGHSTSAHLNAAARLADQLRGLEGFEVPSWPHLAAGVRPNLRNVEDVEPASFRIGWQREAAARSEWQHRERVLKPVLSDSERAACTEWPSSGDEFVRSPFESTDQDRIAAVSGVVAPSIASPFAPCLAFVPMWPSP